MFIDDLIFQMNIFTNVCIRENNTVLDDSTFLDDTSTAYNGVFQRTFNQAAV